MKSLANYLKLWQNKRNELQVDANLAADWAQMHHLLDQHLPVVSPPPAGNAFLKSAGFKLFAAAIITPGLAVLVYLGMQRGPQSKLQKSPRTDSVKTINANAVAQQPDTTSIAGINHEADTLPAANGITNADTNAPDTTNAALNNRTAKGNNPQSGGAQLVNENRPVTPTTGNNIRNTSESHITERDGSLKTADQMADKTRASKQQMNVRNMVNKVGADNKPIRAGAVKNSAGQGRVNSYSNQTPGGNSNTIVSNKYDRNPQTAVAGEDFHRQQWLTAQQAPWSTTASLTDWKNTLRPDVSSVAFIPQTINTKPVKEKKRKPKREKAARDTTAGKVNWGVLLAINPASITDATPGAFVNVDVGGKWAVGAQVRLLSPQKLNGSYTHPNESKKDTSVKTLTITDSRKLYTAQLPVYLAYKATENLSFKAGGLLTLPMKQAGGKSLVSPVLSKDTAYVNKNNAMLNNTKYRPGASLGVTAGAEWHYKRFVFEAIYLQPLRKQTVTSDLGSYTSGGGQLQLSVGFKFNRPKE